MERRTQQSEQQKHPEKFLRQRKFLLVLPLFVWPFLTFIFWKVGFISNVEAQVKQTGIQGLNTNLPNVMPAKDSNWNKLEFYEKADRDSAKYRSLMQTDPYYKDPVTSIVSSSIDSGLLKRKGTGNANKPYPTSRSMPLIGSDKDPNEERVYQKLAELNQRLNSNQGQPTQKDNGQLQSGKQIADYGNDINRIQNAMRSSKMQQEDNSTDPEMKQLNGMLDKVLDIQHPERMEDKIRAQSEIHKRQVYPVSTNGKTSDISLFQGHSNLNIKQGNQIATIPQHSNSFFALDSGNDSLVQQKGLEAEVAEMQTLVSGSTIKLRLLSDVFINGVLVAKNHLVFGTVGINGERLMVAIHTVRDIGNILPVDLTVYDLDGMSGIFVPGAISRDVAKQSSNDAVQSLGMTSFDQTVGAQAAGAGIQAAKTLIGKKVRLVKVTVMSGYRVLLRNADTSNQ